MCLILLTCFASMDFWGRYEYRPCAVNTQNINYFQDQRVVMTGKIVTVKESKKQISAKLKETCGIN